MAYSTTGLNSAGGQSKAGNAPQIWTYTSADSIATVNTTAYFNDASSLVKVGDIIFVYDSATPTMSITYVVSNAAGVVDITDGLTVTATDTD